MKTRNATAPAAGTAGKRRYRSTDRRIVVVDGARLRRGTASDCSRQMAQLEKAKLEWRRFEHQDRKAFERWKAASFGGVLGRLRELESLVRERESLIREVEVEILSGGSKTRRAAHAKVMKRRDQPASDEPPPPQEHDDSEKSQFEDMSEFEQEMVFQRFLRGVMGMNPDRMSDERYEKMFADFKAKARGEDCANVPPPSAPQTPENGRIKDLYRLLVRRLHPDTCGESDAEVSALWHEVQEAYGAGNIDRLEMLLALTDVQSNAMGEHTSLFQMRSVLAELRRSFNAIQRNLRAARKDLAWDFCRLRDRTALTKRVRGNFDSMLQWHEWRLRQLDAEIASWERPAKARGKRARKRVKDPIS